MAAEVGGLAADGAGGADLRLIVGQFRLLDGELAILFRGMDGDLRGAGQRAVHVLLAQRQILPGAGQGQPADAAFLVPEAALRRQRPTPAAAKCGQRLHLGAGGDVGDPGAIGALRGGCHLLVGQVQLPDGQDAVPFLGQQAQVGGAGQRAIDILLAQPQVLPPAGQVDMAHAVLFAGGGAGGQPARPAAPQNSQVGKFQIHLRIQMARREIALPVQRDLRVRQPQLFQPIAAVARFAGDHRQVGAPGQRAVQFADAGAQFLRLTADGQAARARRAVQERLGQQRAAKGGIGIRQVAQFDPGLHVGRSRGDQPLRGGSQGLRVHGQIVDLDPVFVAADRDDDVRLSRQQPVDLFLIGGDVGAGDFRVHVKGAGQHLIQPRHLRLRLPGQRPARQTRQPVQRVVTRCQVTRQRDPARQARHQHIAVQPVIGTGDGQVGQFGRVVGGIIEIGLAGDRIADRLRHGRVVEGDVLRTESDQPGDVLQIAAGQHHLPGPVQFQRADADAGLAEPADPPVQRPALPLRGIVLQRQPAAFDHGSFGKGHPDRQFRRASIRAQRHQQHRGLRRTLIGQAQRARQVHRIGVDHQHRQVQPAVLAPPALGQQLRVVAEKGAVARWQQAGDIAAQFQPESGAGRAVIRRPFGGAGLPGDARLAIGGQGDVRDEIAQRAFALDLGQHGGLVVKIDQIHQQPVAILVQGQVQAKDAGGVGIAGVQREMAARPVLTVDGQHRRPLAPRQVHAAVDGQGGGNADHRLAQLNPARLDAVDADADGQFGQAEFGHFGAGAVLLAARQARQFDPGRGQFRDLDPAAQQGRTVPLDRSVAQGQPDPVRIGDGQFRKCRA